MNKRKFKRKELCFDLEQKSPGDLFGAGRSPRNRIIEELLPYPTVPQEDMQIKSHPNSCYLSLYLVPIF
jgi:hypothetical protein